MTKESRSRMKDALGSLDCPYCEIRSTHAGYKYKFITTHFESKKKEKYDHKFCVKARNEPCTLVQVLEVISSAGNENKQELSVILYNNTLTVFFNGSKPKAS